MTIHTSHDLAYAYGVPEPVAWGVFDGPNLHDMFFTEEEAHEMARLKGDGSTVAPLYTSPAPQRIWVGLTNKEVTKILEMGLGVRDSIETVLDLIKEKNNV